MDAAAKVVRHDDWRDQHDQGRLLAAADASTTQSKETGAANSSLGRVLIGLLETREDQCLSASKENLGGSVLGVVVCCLNAGVVAGKGLKLRLAAHGQVDPEQHVFFVQDLRNQRHVEAAGDSRRRQRGA